MYETRYTMLSGQFNSVTLQRFTIYVPNTDTQKDTDETRIIMRRLLENIWVIIRVDKFIFFLSFMSDMNKRLCNLKGVNLRYMSFGVKTCICLLSPNKSVVE